MGELTDWGTGQWQTLVSLGALGVSVLALWLTQARNRSAAMVLTWHANERVTLENRGPADARDVQLEIDSARQREGRTMPNGEDVPDHMRYEVKQAIALMPAGHSFEDRVTRMLGDDVDSFHGRVTWRDGRLRRQRLEIVLYQRRQPSESASAVLTDRQVAVIAEKLGAGVGVAVREHLRDAARRISRGY